MVNKPPLSKAPTSETSVMTTHLHLTPAGLPVARDKDYKRAQAQRVRPWVCGLLLGAALVCGFGGCAPGAPQVLQPSPSLSAQEIVERYLEARGGRQALERLSAVERIGAVTVYYGDGFEDGVYRTCVAYPDQGLVSIETDVLKVADMLRLDGAFSCEPGFYSCTDAHPRTARELEQTAREANRELLFEHKRWLEAPTVTSRGEDVLVEAELPEGPVSYLFSAATGLLQEKRKGQQRRVYADWRTVSGVLFPFVIEDHFDGKRVLRISVADITVSDQLQGWCARKLTGP